MTAARPSAFRELFVNFPGTSQSTSGRWRTALAMGYLWNCLVPLLFSIVLSTSAGSSVPTTQEYCEREMFDVRCSDRELILVKSAVYGRMRPGRCFRQEYGSIGCKADVLDVVDAKCSGRRQCRFITSDLHRYSTCTSELVAYLEASYECISVTTCDATVCGSEGFFRVPHRTSGYLASSEPSSGGCGSPTCPWVLAPQKGQRFNLTFYSFLMPQQQDKYCQRLASIADKSAKFSKDVTVCSGQEGRTVTQTTPESVLVEVVLYTPAPTGAESPYFSLLRYEVIGCPDRAPPDGGWTKRDGDVLTVGCDRIRRTWHLMCDGTTWIGEAGSCTEDLAQTGVVSPESWDIGIALQQASTTTHGLLLIVGIGIILGILLGFSMLAVAVVLIKRRRRLARLELREACMTLPKTDLASSNLNNLYNQSNLSGSYGTGDKASLSDAVYAAYQLRGTTDLLMNQPDPASRQASIRILVPAGRKPSSPAGGFPPPPPPPGQTAIGGCIDTVTRIPS